MQNSVYSIIIEKVSIQIMSEEISVAVEISVDMNTKLLDVCKRVQEFVIDAVEKYSKMRVSKVNVIVVDILLMI